MEEPLIGTFLATLAEETENPRWPHTFTYMLSLKLINIISGSSQLLGQNWLHDYPPTTAGQKLFSYYALRRMGN